MIDLGREFGSLFHSDLSAAGAAVVCARWAQWATISVAHYGIGITIGSIVLLRERSVAWFWAFLAAIAVKEVAFDIPNSGYAPIVMADSVWDLICYCIGFFALWVMLMHGRDGKSDATSLASVSTNLFDER